jgi:flagellar FliJ protein
MKRFRFTLQAVLEARTLHEERLRKELGAIEAAQFAVRGKLARLHKERHEIQAWQRQARSAKTLSHLVEEACLQKFLADEDAKRRYLEEIHRLQGLIEAKRAELVEASKEKKAVEKLEEKQRREYVLEMNREEQDFLDELARHQFLNRELSGVPAP